MHYISWSKSNTGAMFDHLIQKARSKLRWGETSPLDSLSSTHTWVAALQGLSGYEAHQEVLVMLEKFNRLGPPFSEQHLHILGLIEHAGSKLQYQLIARFLQNQTDIECGDISYWPEITAFYALLAESYRSISLTESTRKKSASSLPITVLRALHYQGKLIQWRYLRYEMPGQDDWEILYNLYQIAVEKGFSDRSLVLKGSAYCTCQSVYARILLLHLMRPIGLSSLEIELAAYWTWKWRDTIQLSDRFDPERHTHFIAAADNATPQPLDKTKPPVSAACYWSVSETLGQLRNLAQIQAQPSSQIKLYGVYFTVDKAGAIRRILSRLTGNKSAFSSSASAAVLPQRIKVSWGEKTVIAELADNRRRLPVPAYHVTIGHPDENHFRLTIDPASSRLKTTLNELLISYNEPMTEVLALSAIRWIEKSGAAKLNLGMEKIGHRPRLVTFNALADSAGPGMSGQAGGEGKFIAVVTTEPQALISFRAIPARYLDMRDGDYIYRIRLQEILEQTRSWVRVQFTLLTRSYRPLPPLS
ncbi:MAG TPA: hypothetical protein VFN66_08340 [Burkholderiales bacterium]|nr:hypothetical protein [Burkholderiales bacterium]